jgi:hypothetical protein
MKKLRVTVDGKTYEVLVEMLDEPAAAAPEPAETTSGATPWWWWAGGLALVLAAGGGAGAFLLLRRRAGSFAGTEGMAGPSSAPPASPVEVLEWDEALDGGLDGALDDEPQPPSAPL